MNNLTVEISETELEVARYLQGIGATYQVSLAAADQKDSAGWDHDLWRIVFSGQEFDFKTGTGHRKVVHGRSTSLSLANIGVWGEGRPLPVGRSKGQDWALIPPTQAGFLYCILSDAGAAEESFEDFCSSYGYDSDSIKSEKIYKECQETAQKINRYCLTPEESEHLNSLLEDYIK